MADKGDYSEIIADILIELQRQSEVQTRILERMERSDAGFNNFALAVLDHMQEMKSDIRELKGDVSEIKGEMREVRTDISQIRGDVSGLITEQKRTPAAVERFADHEERLRRLEDFMRRAS